jgi:hypothetical protein
VTHRPRLALLLALALPFFACDRDKPAPSPAPDDVVAKEAPPGTPASASAAGAAELPAPADVPAVPPSASPSAADSAPAASTNPVAAGKTLGELRMPPAANGILAPGAADRLLPTGRPPIVKLVDAGALPRQAMSYALEKGRSQGIALALDMTLSLTSGGQAIPSTTVPRLTMLLDLATADQNAKGDYRIDAKLNKVTVDPKGPAQEQIATALRSHLGAMAGLGMGYWVTPQGLVHDLKIDVPPDFPAQAQQMLSGMNQSVESMVAPLPAEPVGVGARWQVMTRVTSAGADLLQLSTYELTARDGAKLSLKVGLTQLAASAALPVPGAGGDLSARLEAFRSGGSGTSEIDTTRVAPRAGEMTLESKMTVQVKKKGADGPGEVSSVQTSMRVGFSPPPEEKQP